MIERQVDFTYRRGALIQVIEYGVADRSPDGNGIVRQESAGWPSSGYARVSTIDQNPQLQLDALEGALATRIFTDDGVSGSTA